MNNLMALSSIFIGMFIVSSTVLGQCPNSVIELTSQSDVNNFPIQYPDCEELRQALRIGSDFANPTNITDLTPLQQISYVPVVIDISYNPSLVSLSGLHNVGTSDLSMNNTIIEIRNNDLLSNINVFENLTTLRELSISTNPSLSSLSGFQNLSLITSDLYIGFNNGLSDLQGLESVVRTGSLAISGNTNMTTLHGLENLVNIDREAVFTSNENLQSTSGLSGLETIGNGFSLLRFWNNEGLVSIEGFSSLQSVRGQIIIQDNINLTSIDGLSGFDQSEVTQFNIVDNDRLSLCAVLSVCDYIERRNGSFLIIARNAEGCNNVNEVEDQCLSLPIVLDYFRGDITDDKCVSLTWSIFSDTSVDCWVEHSKNRRAFIDVGNATSSHDNSSYLCGDNFSAGDNYYRLKINGSDDNIHYSPIVHLRREENINIRLYPNPASQFIKVELGNGIRNEIKGVSLYRNNGHVIDLDKSSNGYRIDYLAKGVYYVRIVDNNDDVYFRKVVLK